MVDFSLGPWRELRPGVFVATAEPEGVNVGLVVGDDACLLVDTGSSPAQGRAIRESIATVTDRPLTAVVVTHAHFDHSFGLAAFDDVETIGHESWQGFAGEDDVRATAARLGFDAADLVAPSRPISLLAAKELGNTWVEIAFAGHAHTPGDLVVVVPSRDVMFVGDLIESSGPVQIGEDTSVKNWYRALDSVVGMLKDETMVVPGHGEPVDGWETMRQRSGLAALWGQSEWLVQQGVKEADAYTYDELQWPWDEATARAGITRAYAELAADGAVPRRQLPLLGFGG